jgi:signal transduction histidine kinase
LFAAVPYNYIVPLRYENQLTGILWVDSTPRQYLDDFEPVLLDIARQTSHSLESCRVMEDKIQLERSLMAQRQLAALGNVAASIAHEVKNPLSSIRALTQLMSEDEAFRDKYGRDLGYIIAEIDRLNASMRQLLSFARPTSESVDDVDLSALVSSIVETVRKEKASIPFEIRDRIAPGLILHRASSEALKQIVWNLLLNALQAADEHGSVEVVAEPGGRRDIRLSVCDDGPGIPPAIRDRIFEPYFTTRQKGSGLGLSIVEKNVLSLRGSVEAESPVASGRGARFTVILPEDRPEATS